VHTRRRKLKTARSLLAVITLTLAPAAFGQLNIGENTQIKAGGMVDFGYAGDFGTDIPSTHGLNFGINGQMNGYYYSPNFISFNATPYFNQSRVDSESQSLTGASGIAGTANFFTGSHFPGSVSYHYDENSTGTFGMAGQPNFTTRGNGDGLSIGWSALLPDMPTVSVSYSQGSGGGNIYGTDEKSTSTNHLLNIRSNYSVAGFHLNGFYDHDNFDSHFPEFLSSFTESEENTGSQDYGFGANHNLPLHGSFYANISHASASTNFAELGAESSSYAETTENTGASFHPTDKLSLFANETYTDNLSGYINQSLTNSAVVPLDLGSGTHSMTVGGGAGYNFTNYLYGQAQATHYSQYFFGKNYGGTYISGTLGYSKKLFNLFSFSGSVIESDNGQGQNAVGYIGNVNYYHRFGSWMTSGHFSYAENVQTILITYTSSYYNEGFVVDKRFGHHLKWVGSYEGSHSGINNDLGSSSNSKSFSTSFGNRRFTLQGMYSKADGLSFLTGAGLETLPATPGLASSILFNGRSWGGGLSGTPFKRMILAANFTRALSDTTGGLTYSHNNTEVFTSQLQYRFRRISMIGGYTRFIQDISFSGLPEANTNAFFVGVSRWFDVF